MKTHSGYNQPKATQNCTVCLSVKPLSDFYPCQIKRRCCRVCNDERVRRWVKKNPTKRKAMKDRYRKTPQGRAAYNKQSSRWKRNNSYNAREYKRHHSLNLTDNYLRQLLHHRGVKKPTQEQIESKRRFVQTLRARRAMSLLSYGART